MKERAAVREGLIRSWCCAAGESLQMMNCRSTHTQVTDSLSSLYTHTFPAPFLGASVCFLVSAARVLRANTQTNSSVEDEWSARALHFYLFLRLEDKMDGDFSKS
jgi:hypothetical protein